uniref:Uncharacterized protein n=1 Tax=Candidatus Kentrum sp. TUN TaxID=2126343 RepID=A0A451A0P3_9GAMM|nr:MAG: hypothetical protein BECKTUN1418F_GA0071002_105413 [Candidatus Kentron sp. TUN]VFK59613.1 MAG: hypothetical protein BECKTUN1418E_GA0071001_105413 [Candidatus Kentron sp. TUN]
MPDNTNPPGFIDTFLDEMGQCIRESAKDVLEEKTEDLIEGIAEKEFKPSSRFFDALGNYNRALDKSENARENIDTFERALLQFLKKQCEEIVSHLLSEIIDKGIDYLSEGLEYLVRALEDLFERLTDKLEAYFEEIKERIEREWEPQAFAGKLEEVGGVRAIG